MLNGKYFGRWTAKKKLFQYSSDKKTIQTNPTKNKKKQLNKITKDTNTYKNAVKKK